MEEFVLACLASSISTAFIIFAYESFREKYLNQTSSEKGIVLILEWAIRKECRYHLSVGEISLQDLKDLERMWNIYHVTLRGNGYLDSLMTEVKKLPFKPSKNTNN